MSGCVLGFSTNTWAGVLLQSELGYLKEKTKKGLKEERETERDRDRASSLFFPAPPWAAAGAPWSSTGTAIPVAVFESKGTERERERRGGGS